ncbi:MAG: DUF4198 domain-containing protein, partial [Pseudomonadota bacterium]
MRKTVLTLATAALLSLPSFTMAHETAIVPQVEGPYITGQTVPFTMIASHSFPASDELEAAESMAASFDGTDLALIPNEAILAYEGTATLSKSGAAIIRGHRLAELWSNTPRGWLKGGRDEHKNSVATYKYEKFSKAILPVDGQTDGFDAIVGDKLEIVPVDNILNANVGDEVRVQFLFDGKPITPARVTATYAGFSSEPNTWAFMTEPSDNTALIKLHHNGLWIVRIEHTDYVATD